MAVVSGGTTLIDNGALDAAVPTGDLILLSTQTASASANISFTSGIDSTYDSYVFKFINCHPATNGVYFQFQSSTDGGSSYGVTTTNTTFRTRHDENDGSAILGYLDTDDLAQSTNFINLSVGANLGNENDESLSGTLQLFNPSNTTFVKHYISTTNFYHSFNRSINAYTAGYFNTTSAINAIQFKMDSGNIDDGIIKMYGVK